MDWVIFPPVQFFVWKSFCRIGIISLWSVWVKSPVKPSGTWSFLYGKVFNYKFNLTNRGLIWGFPCGSVVRINLQCRRHGFDLWVRMSPWRRKWQHTPVFLPWKSHGQKSLVDYCPWGCKRVEPDLATEQQQW